MCLASMGGWCQRCPLMCSLRCCTSASSPSAARPRWACPSHADYVGRTRVKEIESSWRFLASHFQQDQMDTVCILVSALLHILIGLLVGVTEVPRRCDLWASACREYFSKSLCNCLCCHMPKSLCPTLVYVRLQGLLLTTYLKFLIADPGDANLKALAEEVFNRYSR